MIETRVQPGRAKPMTGFGFDLKPAGFGGNQTRVLGGFDYPGTQGTRMFDLSPVQYVSQYHWKPLKSTRNGSRTGPRGVILLSELKTHAFSTAFAEDSH